MWGRTAGVVVVVVVETKPESRNIDNMRVGGGGGKRDRTGQSNIYNSNNSNNTIETKSRGAEAGTVLCVGGAGGEIL